MRATVGTICLVASLLMAAQEAPAAYVKVTLLGTGTPRPDPDRLGAATLVEAGGRYFLFDAGRGATVRLHQAGIPPSGIDRLFLTHLHSDHVTGLADLWLTGWIWQRKRPLEVHGPAGVEALTKNLQEAYAADIAYRLAHSGLGAQAASMEAHVVEGEGVVYEEDDVRIRAFKVDHGAAEPAYGYRLEYLDRVVVISGDTTYSRNLVAHSGDADLLVHEIAAADAELLDRNARLRKVMAYHTSPAQLRKVLEETEPRAAVLTHVLLLGPGARRSVDALVEDYEGRLRLGEDLLRIGVGDTIRYTTLPR